MASLDEDWKFALDANGVGLSRGVLDLDFDHSEWATLTALNWWQFQGYPDYRGSAWYRKVFQVEAEDIPKDKARYLLLGAVDGHTEVYLNGENILEHPMNPDGTGWDQPFGTYKLKGLVPGDKVLVIKVTSKDEVSASGILKGVGLFTRTRIKKE